jgi:hypothetical protein
MTSYAPQARDYTSEYESRSELSNFFGDISSFHVTSPEVGEYYMSSVSGSNYKLVECLEYDCKSDDSVANELDESGGDFEVC